MWQIDRHEGVMCELCDKRVALLDSSLLLLRRDLSLGLACGIQQEREAE